MRPSSSLERLKSDRGSAVAEFVLVAALLSLVFAGVLQVCLTIHVRNTVTDAAVAGARVLAMGDGNADDAREVTRILIVSSLGERFAGPIDVGFDSVHGDDVAVVEVTTAVPVIGMWGPTGVMTRQGRAFVEPVFEP